MDGITKKFFYDISLEELETFFISSNIEKYRAKQVWQFVYQRGVSDFSQITNLSKIQRQLLSQHFILERLELEDLQTAEDGTRKMLIRCLDGNNFEAVIIPEQGYFTVCVSSQIGCNMGCKFCCTGSQKTVRDISSGEIVCQFLLAKDLVGDWGQDRKVKNIVFMGMGEPLLNFDNVAKAIKTFTSHEGLDISRRNITISTCGIVPGIKQCANELKTKLALSLHAVEDTARTKLMPINKKFPLTEVINACKDYSKVTKTKITFEYVLIDGVNDSEKHAQDLIRLIAGINAKINLIPFNEWEGCDFVQSSEEKIMRFAKILKQKGYEILIRRSKGSEVQAACGQLKMKKV